jgi:riboflavin synthase
LIEVEVMFTGIIQQVGVIKEINHSQDNSIKIKIDCKDLNKSSQLGESISIDGICLTVDEICKDSLTFVAISETVDKTKISTKQVGAQVNVERAASMQDLVGGHPTTGHIDSTGTVIDQRLSDNWEVLRVEVPSTFSNLMVKKGSISIDGVSLTISDLSSGQETWFEVSLIPATLTHTTLKQLQVGDLVNIEFDQVGKYIAKNLQMQSE